MRAAPFCIPSTSLPCALRPPENIDGLALHLELTSREARANLGSVGSFSDRPPPPDRRMYQMSL